MSEPSELLPLAKSLYDAFKDRKGLEWMGPFDSMSYSRQENWVRVAKEVIRNRWAGFEKEEVDQICNALSKARRLKLCEEAASECRRRDDAELSRREKERRNE